MNEIVRGAGWSFGAQVTTAAFGLLNVTLIARLYGSEVLGIVSLLSAYLVLAGTLGVMGTNISILRFVPEYITKYSSLSAYVLFRKVSLVVGLVSASIAFVLYGYSNAIAGELFGKPDLAPYIQLVSLFVVFKAFVLLGTYTLRSLKAIKSYALFHVLPSVTRLIVLVALAFFLMTPSDPIYAMLVSVFVTALSVMAIAHVHFTRIIEPNSVAQKVNLVEILKVSWPMGVSGTVTLLNASVGVLILSIYFPMTEVGLYAVAVKLATLTTFVLTSVRAIAAPSFSQRYYSHDHSDLRYIATRTAKLSFIFCAPILLVLIIMGRPVLPMVFGPEFSSAYMPMLILVVGQLVSAISGAVGALLNMCGHQTVQQNLVILSCTLNALLGILLIPQYGALGAAIAGTVGLVSLKVFSLLFIYRTHGFFAGYMPAWGRGLK